MTKSKLQIGKTYRCLPIGCIHPVDGEILSIHENTVVLEVFRFNRADRASIIDKQYRVLVKKGNIYEEVAIDEYTITSYA